MNSASDRIQTYREFWPFYLGEHTNKYNRYLHFVGTSISIALLVTAIFTLKLKFVGFALLSGYGFAWIGHFIIEKNRPATFKYPFWSFISDFKLWFFMLTRKSTQALNESLRKKSSQKAS